MPAGWNTLRSDPPHVAHSRSGASEKRWKTSMCVPQDWQAYSYVGMPRV
jgi:hypothetical protein